MSNINFNDLEPGSIINLESNLYRFAVFCRLLLQNSQPHVIL